VEIPDGSFLVTTDRLCSIDLYQKYGQVEFLISFGNWTAEGRSQVDSILSKSGDPQSMAGLPPFNL